jgi:hypothetical protein
MTFGYTISDTCIPGTGTATATVTLTYPSPGAPVATDDAYTCTYGAPCGPTGPGPLANDRSQTGCPINMSAIVTQPSVGSVTFTPNGQFTYTPPQ